MKQHRTHHYHTFWMALLCILPMGLIFLLPAFGVNIGALWLLVPLLCVGSHFLMMHGHHHDAHDQEPLPHELHDGRRNE
jgi:hypothetical protein